ncbi:SigB/SigF/SigG family RNA polymerase sigma factor [Actinomadura parmotrematis]|uniref:SigB/SigF/SigG family RNA polymerase sigma factor n=1 Tax=Actinomadura parmotrematis TaxID=2864039 RepID=A0ABS7G4P4_9ACTN|nr:SigB/SigF/SigG family RNA polymerase sigma factor [Actinomadura parmotrematis]MBW8487501.1 SigB/SigF/SigG family RNA polymerase sigma factor [Actinomadura parmotrematis]
MSAPTAFQPAPVPPGIEERLAEMKALPPGDPRRERLREQIILSCTRTVRAVAGRFGSRGEAAEDLFQVGMIGLIAAVDRYDPGRGNRFMAFAMPTVTGEIKRHFRDRGWTMRPPREVQERWARVNEARPRLTQTLGRSPTVADLAGDLGFSEEEVVEAITAGDDYHARSLDRRADDDPDGPTIGETIADPEPEMDLVAAREAVRPALRRLPERERHILLLRFHGNKTQREIADIVGLSQMHVSRLIRDSLAAVRAEVEEQPA